MKTKFFMCTIVMAMMCFHFSANAVVTNDSINSKLDSLANYDGYAAELAADTINIKESIQVIAQEPVLIFEKDTFDFGTIERVDAVLLEHILCKCNSSKDVCIKKSSITNMHGRISTSPRIVAGTKGTILCLIDKKSLKLGEHVDKITILTDSEVSPEVCIYVKYNVVGSTK